MIAASLMWRTSPAKIAANAMTVVINKERDEKSGKRRMFMFDEQRPERARRLCDSRAEDRRRPFACGGRFVDEEEEGEREKHEEYRGDDEGKTNVEQIERVGGVGKHHPDNQQDGECPGVSHREAVSRHAPIGVARCNAGQECVVKDQSPFKPDIGGHEQEEAGEDHPFANEKHHCGSDDRHNRKEEEKSLPVPGEIRGCPQRRGEEGREDHRKTDRKSPEPAASPRDSVGEVAGVDNGDDNDGEGRVGEVEEGPCENLPAGCRCLMARRRGCGRSRG
jgi:hypothetical protein